MVTTLTSIVALLASFATVGVIIWFVAKGDGREDEEAARAYYERHGRWPDDEPDSL